MKKIYVLCLSWSLGIIGSNEQILVAVDALEKIPVVQFDSLMHIGNPSLLAAPENASFYGVTGMKILDLCRTLYQNMIGKLEVTTRAPKIPKKIHQIWLGSPFPEKYKRWQEQIKKLHPDWEYKLWTDKDVAEFEMVNRKIYRKAGNWGEKSDILRYEILYREGGVYLDCDVQCFANLDDLHKAYDFYAGFEPFWAGSETRCLSIGNAIIAAAPKHPIMKRCIKNIKKFSRLNFPLSYNMQTVAKTGPIMFTRSCYEILSQDAQGKNNIIFPSKLFYPEDTINRDKNVDHYFVHYWSHSWMK